ncbi:histidine kinase [Streptomyces sp. NBC_01537]|uniref:sensor histidine kinase n=1 Tax=Streptomyces sp. NBC_01537 TaxID=2903896 RepID=UPI00386ADAEF
MDHLSPAVAPPPPRSRGYGCAQWAGTAVLGAGIVADLTTAEMDGPGMWALLAVELAALAALMLPAGMRPAWLTPLLRACVPALLAAALNVILPLVGYPAAQEGRFGQTALLLCLLAVAVRYCASVWAAALSAVVVWGALMSMPLTAGAGLDDPTTMVFVLTLLMVPFAGIGGFLRSTDRQRREAMSEVRRAERVEIAADLHDFVAHHVTGILVQTQMARMLAAAPASDPASASGPDRLDPVLAGIEHSATEALASMRRLVGVLRTHSAGADVDGAAAPVRPVGDLAQLADLVDDFTRVGPRAELTRAPSVPAALPHEVEAAAFRVAQEALTNVRRHAADATLVRVGLSFADNALEVCVRDDGHGSTALPHAARGGGYGLVGLAERVSALDGELTAGPWEGGWEVLARLPVTVGTARGMA